MKIDIAIETSQKILMQYWPLQSFISTNPLWSLKDKPFHEVVADPYFNAVMDIEYYQSCYHQRKITNYDLQQAIELIEKKSLSEKELNQWVNTSFIQEVASKPPILLSEQLDEYQFQIPTAWIKEHIFTILRDYFGLKKYQHINLLNFWQEQKNENHRCLQNITLNSIDRSIAFFLKKLNIPADIVVDYFKSIYLQVYGWSSFMNWRNHHPNNPWVPSEDPCEVILLMWLAYEYVIATEKKIKYKNNSSSESILNYQKNIKIRYIWQTALELNYINQFDSLLNKQFAKKNNKHDAQFIFCIDARSEGLRRHIEAQGFYQTFGFAGFFGAIFKLNHDDDISYQAPALIEAPHTLIAKSSNNKLQIFIKNIKEIVNYTKKQLLAPFVLFEILGFWFAFYMIFKTFQPKLKEKHKKTNLKINNTLLEDEKFYAAYNLLTSIGLIDNFSDWIVICAHQSDNINNPFKASLNCGACGGNSGIPNAIVMCQILNQPKIRLKLKNAGINIPDHSQFLAACHHTGYDRLEVIEGSLPKEIQYAINSAANNLRKEKKKTLPGINKISQREQNWSELIPELGLVNNTAMIIGPRELTINKNLKQRTFLHSYEPSLDKNGEILTNILSAPAIVTHWISAQYYFSTINPELFGAGNKAIHNVLPGIGVLAGNLSDLKIGLPLQSTHFQSRPLHEPRRMLMVIYAHTEILQIALENAATFKILLDNNWIYLKHIEVK